MDRKKNTVLVKKQNSEITCGICGEKTIKGNFCINCGNLQSDTFSCPYCSKPTKKVANFCTQCGTKLYEICPTCPHNSHKSNSCSFEKCPKS